MIASDGSPVDLFACVPPGNEPEIVHGAIPDGASILELGAGAGRITHSLIRLGHAVVAVDSSPDMLAHIEGAETVCSPIESLALGRRFDAVLMMSYLIHAPDRADRHALLATCRAHIHDPGRVIIQWRPPEWFDTAVPDQRVDPGGYTVRMRDVQRVEHDLLAATMVCGIGERVWTHTFVRRRLSDALLREELAAAGLAIDGFLTTDRAWLRARPVEEAAE